MSACSSQPLDRATLGVNNNMSNSTLFSMGADDDNGITSTVIAVVIMLSIFSVVGVVGNAIVFYIFFRRRNSSTSVIFILALAGTDFITCLITIPYTIAHELLRYHLVYDLVCKTYMFLITSTVPFSAFIMVGIALDRYFCICHPFLYVVTIPRAKAIIFGMGIPALTFGTLTALMYGTYIYRERTVANITSWFNVSHGQHSNDEILSLLYKDHEHNPSVPGLTLDSIYTIPGSSIESFDASPATNYTMFRYIHHYKKCVRNNFIFTDEFVNLYTKVHAMGFVIAYLIVAVLYILIYKSIYTRRANKAKRRKNNLYPLLAVGAKSEETQMSIINHGPQNTIMGLPNNQQKHGSDPCCARKIVLTARNDSGVYPPKTLASSAPNALQAMEHTVPRQKIIDQNHSHCENVCDKDDVNINIAEDSRNHNKVNDKTTIGDNSQEDGMTSMNGHVEPLLLTTPTLRITASDNDDDDKTDDEREECYRVKIPLIQQATIPDPPSPVTFVSNNTLVSVPSPSHSRNTLVDTALCFADQMSRSCPSLSPVTNHTAPVDHESKSQSYISTTATVSPAVSPPTSLPIKNTFKPIKSTDTKPKSKHLQTDAQTNSIKRKRQTTLRDRNMVANIKTAFMLFIVTLVFIIAFLPALLMANSIIPLNLIFFYIYFVYNVVNPFIYAFMNQTFREDLKKTMNIVCSR